MFRARPLSGKTVVVTRPRAQAGALCALLEKQGARVVAAPLIKIVHPLSYARLDAALRRLAAYDIVVFASRNAVSAVFSRLRRLRLAAKPPRSRVYAIGPRTAEAVKEHGWKAAAVPQAYNGEALARKIGKVKGKRILLPRALRAREQLPRLLRYKGARVDAVTAYRTVPDEHGRRRLRRAAGRIDAVTFTSGSTVEQFVGLLSWTARRRLFKTAAAASIGPVTSAALRKRGFTAIIEARKATDEGLSRALARHFS